MINIASIAAKKNLIECDTNKCHFEKFILFRLWVFIEVLPSWNEDINDWKRGN